MKRLVILWGVLILLLNWAFSQNKVIKINDHTTLYIQKPVYFDVSPPLRDMIKNAKPPIYTENEDREELVAEAYERFIKSMLKGKPQNRPDPLSKIQQAYYKNYGGAKAVDLEELADFEGVNNLDNVAPPDTQGDVNDQYYMQCVNSHAAIYQKDGTLVEGPFPLSDFWSGTPYGDRNDGDAVILWDEDAQRWFVTQFYVPDNGDQAILIAVSQSSDPRGAYYRWAFVYDYMPDYPKYAVWHDGYYMGANAFDQNNNYAFKGAYISAFDRNAMINGLSNATAVTILDANQWSIFPTDADVLPDPSVGGCFFVNDMLADYTGNNEVYIYQYNVDWNNQTASLNQVATIQVTPYDLFTSDQAVVPQQGSTQKLDLLHYRIMFRPYYRPFSDHQTILMTRTVNDNGIAAIRWYEFRNSGSGWSLYQEGTYNPGDGHWRWMPSIAMNANGDIALGYSISSSSKYPSICVVARYASDPLGVMTTNELEAFSGSASQSGVSRWGDYSMVSIDPSDNYSFWFTTEYSDGGWSWRTRIIHFRLPILCTQPTPQASNISFSDITDNSFTVSWTRGGGDAELVLVKEGAPVDSDPVSGTTYNADSQFGQGDEIGVGNFVVYDGSAGTVTVTGLNPSTTYYVAVYTYNAADHCYNVTELTGSVTTYGPPTVTTADVTNITGETAESGGEVLSENGSAVTARGVCWNTTGSPTISDAHTTDGSGLGTFTSQLTGLTPLTTYYVRAYATNAYGTSYGEEKQFTTACGTIRDYPYVQNFDSWPDGGDNSNCVDDGSVQLYDCWENATGEDTDWKINSGGTASWSTGPSGDHTSGSGEYLYIESSSPCYSYKQATALTPVFDLSILLDGTFSFWYNMYGSSMGDLYLEASTDGGNSWTTLWSLGGDQGTDWQQATIDLVSAGLIGSPSVIFRFRGVTGDGYRSDMAIDDINVDGTIEYRWNGSISEDWQTAGNWTPNRVPSATDYARIPAGCPNYPNIDESGDVCYRLIIEDGGSLRVSTGDLTVGTDMIVGEGSSGEVRIEGGSITVNGNATFKANSYLGISGGTINFAGVSLDPSSTTEYYANTDQDIYNWRYGDLILSGSGNKKVLGTPVSVTVCEDLTINDAAVLYIDGGRSMTVRGTLTNNVGTQGLIINSFYDSGSGETYSGSLILYTANVGGKVISHLEGTQWHYVSSPIDGAPRSMFNPTNFLYWDASALWLGVDDNDYTPWHEYNNTNLENGVGYAYYYYTTDLEYEGNLNVGSYNMTLRKYTGTGGEEQDQGWNLLGNPYSAPLNWDKVAQQASIQNGDIEGAVYLFDDDAQTGLQSNYRYYVPASPGTGGSYGVGTSDASKYVPVGQGFFVRSTIDNSVLVLDTSYREHGVVGYYKRTEDSSYQQFDLIRLFIKSKENNSEDELVIRSLPNGHKGFDGLLDARKMYISDEAHPMLYSLDGAKENAMAINTVGEVINHISIPLGVWTSEGSYEIELREDLYSEQIGIYIEDLDIGIVKDLRSGKYEFSSGSGIHNDRFVLHLVKNSPPFIWNDVKELISVEDQQFAYDLSSIFRDTTLFDKLSYEVSGVDWLYVEEGHLVGIPSNSEVGEYNITVTATDKYGESVSKEIRLIVKNVNDAPILNGELEDQEVIAGEIWIYEHPSDLFIDIDPDDEITYSSRMSEGELPLWISYDSEQYRFVGEPTLMDVGEYEIEVIGTDLSGASDTTSFKLRVLEPTKVLKSGDVLIYPNPTKGDLYLYNLLKAGAKQIELIDNTGKVLIRKEVHSDNEYLDLNKYAVGVYNVRIVADENIMTIKIVKQ